MTIALCPRCSEQVRVLDDASPAAIVRCPLCQEEYSLAEALRQLPPLLIMVRDPETLSRSKDFAPSPWDSLDDLTDDLEVAEPVPIALEKASPAVAVSLDKGTSTKPKAVAKIRSSARAKPKGSPIKSIISIVLGGLLAFPIAQLILWYLPGDLKRDFGAGPVVAQYLPQIVPAKFRGNKSHTDASGQPTVVDSDSSIPDFRFGEADTFGGTAEQSESQDVFTGVAPRQQATFGAVPSPSEDQPPMQDREVEDDVFASPVGIPGLEIGGLKLDPLPEIAPPSALDAPIATVDSNPATVPAPTTTVPIDEAAPSESAGLAVGQVRQPRSISGDDLSLRLANAVKVNTSWHEITDGVATRSLKRDYYVTFSKLGEALVFADQDQTQTGEQRAAAAELLQTLVLRREQRDFVGSIASGSNVSGWINLGSEKRETDGICLFGVVKSIEKQGEVFVTNLESGGKSLAVVSTTDPSDTVDIDREVLVLGSILHDPAKNLGGYVGSHAVVVLHGLHVTVDPE